MSDVEELRVSLMRATARTNAAIATALPIGDSTDFEAARKGHLSNLPEGGVRSLDGGSAWDIARYDFLQSECPQTVNPSLWRMAQLNSFSGLFEVADGVWQARACDY